MKKDVRNVVLACLEEIGICVDKEATRDENINDYSVDSLSFMSFIISVEERLDIIIPDGYFYVDLLKSLNGFVDFLETLIEERNKMKGGEEL